MRLGHRLAVNELGANVEDREQNQWEVVGDKSIGCPTTLKEDLPARELTG